MADKLGLGPEVRELRLGSSFSNKGSAFHTFRYDFKPASVDTSKMATVDILPNNEVTVTVPHTCDGTGTAQTSVFRGPKKPYTKECVLIIDHNTGEITLERLSHNIQLKKTRAEGSSKIARPSSPVEPVVQSTQSFSQLNHKKPSPVRKSPPTSSSPKEAAPSPPYKNSVEPPHVQHRASPKHATSRNRGASSVSSPSRQAVSASSTAFASIPGSMPLFCDLDGEVASTVASAAPQNEATAMIGVLSDSSDSDSGSDSSSNSSESDSDSDEMDTTPIPVAQQQAAVNGRNGIGCSSSSSSSSNGTSHHHPSPAASVGREAAPASNASFPHLSMPSHLLSEDLQLSDSGSDSD